ncbi:hypothetical protein ACFQX4_02490 [Roseomonas sp. GCM10028921]
MLLHLHLIGIPVEQQPERPDDRLERQRRLAFLATQGGAGAHEKRPFLHSGLPGS